MYLTKEELLKLRRQPVEKKVFDIAIYLLPLSYKDYLQFCKNIENQESYLNLLLKSIVDKDGNQQFSTAEELENLHFEVLKEITKLVLEINGLSNT